MGRPYSTGLHKSLCPAGFRTAQPHIIAQACTWICSSSFSSGEQACCTRAAAAASRRMLHVSSELQVSSKSTINTWTPIRGTAACEYVHQEHSSMCTCQSPRTNPGTHMCAHDFCNTYNSRYEDKDTYAHIIADITRTCLASLYARKPCTPYLTHHLQDLC